MYIVNDQVDITKAGQRLIITNANGENAQVPIAVAESIILFGYAKITTQAMRMCLENGVSVFYATLSGKLLGSCLAYSDGQLARKIRQYDAYHNVDMRLSIAKAFVSGKIAQQERMLMQNRKHVENGKITRDMLMNHLEKARNASSLESLLGSEGTAAKIYFGTFDLMLLNMSWNGRTRHPPTDPVNALLSLSYMMALGRIVSLCHGAGYEPGIGFLHELKPGRPSLACDFLELIRPSLDHFVIKLLNRKELIESDFVQTKECVRLKDNAFSRFVEKFEQTEPLYKQVDTAIRVLDTGLTGRRVSFEEAIGFCSV